MANNIAILKETKTYTVVRMPKKLAQDLGFEKKRKREMTEDDVLRLVREAMREHGAGRTKVLRSLRDLR